MTTHLAQLTLTFHGYLERIATATTPDAKQAAEADLAQFLRSELARIERRYPARQAGEPDE